MGISRRHFRIQADADGNYVISDLNSLNGITVNSAKVTSAVLHSGDQITIGRYEIIFEIVEETAIQEARLSDTDLNAPVEESVSDDDAIERAGTDETGAIDEGMDTVMSDVKDIEQIDEQDTSAAGPYRQSDTTSVAVAAIPVLIETNKHVVYKLDKPVVTLGSSENDDIFVSGFMVGDEHVTIEKESESFFIKSKKLMGKFKVNGKKTNSHLLEHKDRIEIGNCTFRYMENE
jgi:pSer/pThr/pTyr-binding forkhead associated (FHA) protein